MYSEIITVEPRDKEPPSPDTMMRSKPIEAIDKVVKKLVAESRVRELLPEGIRMSADAIDGLDQAIRKLVEFAVVRCQANKRKTIFKEDF